MSPTPDPDVVADLAAVVDETARSAAAVPDAFSWNLDGDVLRDLLTR